VAILRPEAGTSILWPVSLSFVDHARVERALCAFWGETRTWLAASAVARVRSAIQAALDGRPNEHVRRELTAALLLLRQPAN
jgi:hypothetical protein